MNWVLLQATEMKQGTEEAVFNDLTGISRLIYENAPNYDIAGYITFFTVFILCAIVYKLGFARSHIKLWQNAIIYGCLFIGCIVLTFFALSLPMIEGLLVAAAILIIYRIRVKHDDEEAVQ